ncbi:divergent polysaccharide deacetylase family protein [uncultured Rhodospira sp.]|uniref:divergent polysaccharide deacetylase family protein n=1 Tax=uncultured Rhodospira sp. TaxID=1936189 RepID=UPI00261194BB|nr:divergent polysaccharide deacetylase family protein [uncultured Rhodospira sp.]
MTAGSTGSGKGRGSARGTGKGGARGGRRASDTSAAKRAPKKGASASTTAKAKARPQQPAKTAPKSGPKKTAAKPAARKTTAKRASASARPAWAVSGNGGARRAMGRAPGVVSRRAMAGGAVLFAVGLVAGLRLRPESAEPPAPLASAPVPPSPRRPGTVTLADVPDASAVRIDLPMAEGASPEVLETPAAPSRVVRPDETVLASRPPAPVPGPKPAEGHQPAPASNTASNTVASAGSEPLRITPEPDPAPSTARVPASPRAPLWLANAMNVPHPGRRPMVAVVIDDLGVDRARTARVLSLPGPLTLSFMSYAKELPGQAAAGRAFGHERMLHMPMQPGNADIDPGPGALYVDQSAAEIRRRLDRALGAFSGYIGLNNHMGSRFTADAAGMRVVMDVARRRELLFLDSRTTGASVAPRLAAAAGVPFLERTVFLDHNPRRSAVDRQLAELERVATRHGHAVAIGHPRDATIAALAAWIEPARARGLALVPASAITRFARSV